MSSRGYGRHTKPDRGSGDPNAARERQCLLCRIRFASAWSGERVCQPCKKRSLWSSGVRSSSGSRPA